MDRKLSALCVDIFLARFCVLISSSLWWPQKHSQKLKFFWGECLQTPPLCCVLHAQPTTHYIRAQPSPLCAPPSSISGSATVFPCTEGSWPLEWWAAICICTETWYDRAHEKYLCGTTWWLQLYMIQLCMQLLVFAVTVSSTVCSACYHRQPHSTRMYQCSSHTKPSW